MSSFKFMKIAIDDGHGSETSGKRTPEFPDGTIMKENEFNRAVADYLECELKEQGFSPAQVAPERYDVPLNIRTKRANQIDADLYISIHANAAGNGWGTANGIETYVHTNADMETVRIAEKIHSRLIAATGRKDRGVKRSDFYVLRKTKMPAVLLECGFMTNMEEAKLLKSDHYRRKCAEAICRGICDFYGKKYHEGVEQMGEKRYQTIGDAPEWARPLLEDMDIHGCFGDSEHIDLSMDMLRTMVLMDRYLERKEAVSPVL